MSCNLVIFTDLDGTLLDHHSYSFAAASEAISCLKAMDIPWILNSSKTLSELKSLRLALHQRHPLIVENGAGVAIPADYQHPLWSGLNTETAEEDAEEDGFVLHSFGLSRKLLLEHLAEMKQQFAFTGFADMDVPQLCDLTGLSPSAATLAMDRHFSEPLIWQDSETQFEAFQQSLQRQGLSLLRGGRFIHVMGSADKGRAMSWLLNGFNKAAEKPFSVALGDSHNDLAMLNRADIAVVVRSPVHQPPQLADHDDVRLTEVEGPAGWNQKMLEIIAERCGTSDEKPAAGTAEE